MASEGVESPECAVEIKQDHFVGDAGFIGAEAVE